MKKPLAVLAVLTFALPASAGDRTPVSTIAPMSAPRPGPATTAKVEGVKIDASPSGAMTYIEARAATARGYCFVGHDPTLLFQDSITLASPSADELWHLVETETDGTLERIEVKPDLSDNTLRVRGRSTVKLSAVGKIGDITAWAFRDPDGSLVLLARGGDMGREAGPILGPKEQENRFIAFSTSACTFGGTRMDKTTLKAGGVAQLRGALPKVGEGKLARTPRYSLDASVAKLSRDPEPMLSIRLRELLD